MTESERRISPPDSPLTKQNPLRIRSKRGRGVQNSNAVLFTLVQENTYFDSACKRQEECFFRHECNQEAS